MLAPARCVELSLLPDASRRMSTRGLGYVAALALGTIDREDLHRIGQPAKRDVLSIPQVSATNESDCTLAS